MRICKKCNIERDLTLLNKGNICLICTREYAKERNRKLRTDKTKTIECKYCKTIFKQNRVDQSFC